MVLYSSIHNGYYFISFIAILVSVISASYYLKIIQVMYFRNESERASKPTNQMISPEITLTSPYGRKGSENSSNKAVKQNYRNSHYSELGSFSVESPNSIPVLSNLHSTVISIMTMFITLFIIHPSIIINSCEIISLSIFNYLYVLSPFPPVFSIACNVLGKGIKQWQLKM